MLALAGTPGPESKSIGPKAPSAQLRTELERHGGWVAVSRTPLKTRGHLEPLPGVILLPAFQGKIHRRNGSVSSNGRWRSEGDKTEKLGCAALSLLGQDIRATRGGSCWKVSRSGGQREGSGFPREARMAGHGPSRGKPHRPFRFVRGRET